MKLNDWFEIKNADGSKRLKGAFASAIGVSASMITEYCNGTAWPAREIMRAIERETAGAVTANDFVHEVVQ